MIWHVIILLFALSSFWILIKYRNINNWKKFLVIIAGFFSTFILVLNIILILNDFSFKKYLWQKWACWDGSVENDDFRSLRRIESLGIADTEFNISCKSPLEYSVKINKFGTRSTPPEPTDWSKINTALLGCSYIWGTGLNEKETVSYYLQSLNKNIVVNYGVPGGSASSALRLLELIDHKKVPVGSVDDIVYTVRDGHYVRDTGKGRWLFHPRNAHYKLIDDRPVYQGIFNNNFDIAKYKSVNPFAFAGLFLNGLMHLVTTEEKPTNVDVEFTAKIINKMYYVSTKRLKSRFYLNIWPESSESGDVEARRAHLLMHIDKNIPIFQLNQKLGMMAKGRHPTTESAYKMADFISKSIQQERKQYEADQTNSQH